MYSIRHATISNSCPVCRPSLVGLDLSGRDDFSL